MGKHFLAACLAATVLVPASALAQQSCERQRSNRVAATVGGAAVGGVVDQSDTAGSSGTDSTDSATVTPRPTGSGSNHAIG